MKVNLFLIFSLIWVSSTIIYGQNSGSFNFNGIDNFIQVKDSPLNEIDNGDFTLEAWIKGNDSEQKSHPMIFSNRGTDAFGGGVLFFLHDNWRGSKSKLLCLQVDAINYMFIDNGCFNGSLLDGECHHVAVTRKGNDIALYADGILIGQLSPMNLGSISLDEPLLIGKDAATNNTFNGTISHFRIWNIARTQEEIIETKNKNLEDSEGGLLASWDMSNSDEDQVIFDKIGGFNGVLGTSNQQEIVDPEWLDQRCNGDFFNNEDLIFQVFPNPTTQILNISYRCDEAVDIQIFDTVGRLVFYKKSAPSNVEVDLENYATGVYFINLRYKDQYFSKKVMKL